MIFLKFFRKKGVALFSVMILCLVLASLCAAYSVIAYSNNKNINSNIAIQRALNTAEAGLHHAIRLIVTNNGDQATIDSILPNIPDLDYDASYTISIQYNTPKEYYYQIKSTGTYNKEKRTIEATLYGDSRHPLFFHAMYAANKNSGASTMGFGGVPAVTCPTCGGAKVVTCTTCGGDGKVTCGTCGGDGIVDCTCGGDGRVTCSHNYVTQHQHSTGLDGCTGTGNTWTNVSSWRCKRINNKYQHQKCTNTGCNGSTCTCTACGGSGASSPCTVCTAGQVNCTVCGGDGLKTCPTCSGNGVVYGSGSSDIIEGDIYNNGNINFTETSEIIPKPDSEGKINDEADGEAKAHDGTVTSDPGATVTKVTDNADEIEAPDIVAMNYTAKATSGTDKWLPTNPTGKYVNVADEFTRAPYNKSYTTGEQNMKSTVATTTSDSPGHIFARDVYSNSNITNQNTSYSYQLWSTDPFTTSTDRTAWRNKQYFTLDAHSGCTGGERLVVAPAHNNKAYFIDGNLWVESGGYGPTIKTSDGSALAITIIVKGNIYICDAVYYDKTKDAVAFMAVADGRESYVDLNSNNKWDSGEPILNDQPAGTTGNGVYQGPIEGCGNIYFGDPSCGHICYNQNNNDGKNMNVFYGLLYAENDFTDHAMDNDGVHPFTVYGIYSAGNRITINRNFTQDDGTVDHAGMHVIYDDRIPDLTLPCLPIDNRGHPTSWSLKGFKISKNCN